MTDRLTDIADFDLPFRRKAMLRRVDFDGGLSMLRLVLKEGTRITQVDMDAVTAARLGEALTKAAKAL